MVWMTNLIYVLIVLVLSPAILCRQLIGRRPIVGLFQKLSGKIAPRQTDGKCIWFHAVSLGEINVLQSVVEHWKKRFPACDVAISTTTRTGMERAREIFPGLNIFYMPYDFSWAVNRVVKRLRPSKIVLAELEVWPNLLRIAHQNEIPVSIINGRLSQKSFHAYIRFGFFVKPLFKMLESAGVQNKTYKSRFVELGVDPKKVVVTGNIKFDNANQARYGQDSPNKALGELEFTDELLWVAGSTHHPEEQTIVRVYRELKRSHTQLRLVIVPRHPERGDELVDLVAKQGIPVFQRSKQQYSDLANRDTETIIVADTIGELTHWWKLANIAFVGGSMTSRGGQNMIEPAALGTAVCFGPNTWNFSVEVNLLLSNDGAVEVRSEQELAQFVHQCIDSKAFRQKLADKAKSVIAEQNGAIDKTIDLISHGIASLQQVNQDAA